MDSPADASGLDVLYIRGGGAALAIDATSPRARVLHWGKDLGPLDSRGLLDLLMTSVPTRLNTTPSNSRHTLVPTEFDGWSGNPGLVVARGGVQLAPRLQIVECNVGRTATSEWLSLVMFDDHNAFAVECKFELDEFGVLEVKYGVRSSANSCLPLDIGALTISVPLPDRAQELLDFTGKWCRERAPQRHRIVYGTHLRQVRGGKPGLDSPHLFVAGTPGFGSRIGEVWAMHVAWSGDQQWLVERYPAGAGALGAVMGGGELLRSGEVRLKQHDVYESPRLLFVWSECGTDGVAAAFHAHLRARPEHPRSPRPLVLNSWEAVYFDHDIEKLRRLVDCASVVGVERFVLDDGWFEGRANDHAGLGDWTVDRTRWPDGLHPLVQRVRSHGMQFGLWVEPEMINLDSDLARAHPDWVLGPSEGLGMAVRDQYVLNLTNSDAWAYILDRLNRLVFDYSIDYLKWDHNRDLSEAFKQTSRGDFPAVHDQTRALYSLLDELHRRHPALEIESCASGGGRIDLEMLQRTQRVWPSDCNDPLERQQIQQWTSLLIPPELMGSHIGSARSHTTDRVTNRSFRLNTAIFAHAGIEWDLTGCDDEELAHIKRWGALYKQYRDLIHHGNAVRADIADPAFSLHGVVDSDGRRALYEWVQLTTAVAGQSGRVPFPGLVPSHRYQLRVRSDMGEPSMFVDLSPEWYQRARAGWMQVDGSVLATAGLPMPTLNPANSVLIEVMAN